MFFHLFTYPIVLEGVGVVSDTSPELALGVVLSSPEELATAAVVLVVEGPLLRPGRSLGLKDGQ